MKTQRYFLLFTLGLFIFAGCERENVRSSDESNYNALGMFDNSRGFNGNGNNPPNVSGENYNDFEENDFIKVSKEPVSTFSIDADGASYANSRRFISQYASLPPPEAIRTEEFINYFPFDYAAPTGFDPIALNGEVSICPWKDDHKLIRIGIQGRKTERDQLPPSNLVLLIDVSGSMGGDMELPLLKIAFKKFVDEMRPQDKLAIVTYAGSSGVALQSTDGTQKNNIKNAIDNLHSGGSTAGAEGILTAYEIANDNFIEGGNNRIVLGTDGDFNVGPSSTDELIEIIEEQRESGVFLTVLGVGAGNLNEGMMEQLANHGNGNFEYLDSEKEAEKVMIHDYGKFYTVAKDVKVQIEFNASVVKEYRLIGYENRVLENEDFEDDEKDAGEIGMNQSITALYEIIPAKNANFKTVPTFSIDFRYKFPDQTNSNLMNLDIMDQDHDFDEASENMRFAAAVASFAMLMRDSKYKGNTSYNNIKGWINDAKSFDPHGYRNDLKDLVNEAKGL